jgi:2-methylcitrate dehydratase PrpD
MTALTLGLDIIIRLGRALVLKEPPCNWIRYGWLPQQILGYFSSAAVAGRLMGLDEDQMVKAFGIAYSQTAGVTEEVAGVGVDKAVYPSYAGLAGVLSVLMAQKGITGPTNSLEGKNGLFHVYFQGEYNPSALTENIGKSFEGVNIGFFSFPCCAHTHAYIETALRLVDEYKIRPEDVDIVTLFVGPLEKEALGLCDPLQVRRNPTNISEAQLGLPFTVATAMTKGRPRIKNFVDGGYTDPEILRLSNKVVCQVDPEHGQKVGKGVTRPGIEVRLKGGRVLRSDREVFRYGHPQNPMGREEHIEKFRDCVSYSVKPLPEDSVERLIEMLMKMEEIRDVGEIIRLVS